jgi:hypothetical protein
VFELVSVNVIALFIVPDVVDAMKEATGAFNALIVIYPIFVSILLPAALVAVKLILYVPAVVYMCEGFSVVDVLLSPKYQDHEVGELVLISVNVTDNGKTPEVGVAEKFAIGGKADLGTVNALMHTFVFEKKNVISFQVFPSELIKLCPGFAVALLL